MTNWQLVVFDHDMTIVNSCEAITAGMNSVAERHGLAPVSKEEVLQGIALPLAEAFEKLWGKYDPEWTNHYRESVYDLEYQLIKPFPDTVETLEKLKNMGVRLAVASNRFNPAEALEKTDLLKHFDAVVGLIDKVAPKPAPDMLDLLMKKLGAKKEKTIYVGDALIDMETAKAAGVRGIGVTMGNYDKEQLSAFGAWKTIDSLGEIFECLTP